MIFNTKRGNITIGEGFGNVKDVVTVTTTNTMNEAAGTFQIDLVARKIDGNKTYADILTPLDMVEIEIGSEQTVMMGLIDRVIDKGSVSGNGVNRRISITGRSLGSVWLFDNVKYFRGISADQLPSDLKNRANVIEKGMANIEFYGLSAIEAIKLILEKYTALEQDYNQNPDDNIVPFYALYDKIYYDLATVEGRNIYNPGLAMFEGSVWQYMKSCIIPPFEEMWTDSIGGTLVLRMRPAPFNLESETISRVETMQAQQAYWRSKYDPRIHFDYRTTLEHGWNNYKNMLNDENGHVITPKETIGYNLSKSHGEGASYFEVFPQTILNYDAFFKNATFPPLIDADLMHSLGSRGQSFNVNLVPLTADGALPIEVDITKWISDVRNKAYLWYKDNHKYISGTISVKGNSEYRVGDKIRLQNREGVEKTFYCEGVTNNFTWGQPFTTTLNLTRGATETDRQKWWDDGKYKITNTLISTDIQEIPKDKPPLPDKIPTEVSGAINSVLDAMAQASGYNHANSESAKILMKATAAVESAGFQYDEQQTDSSEEGTAVSYWQVEPQTAHDHYDNYLKSTNEKRVELEEKINSATGVSKDSVDMAPFVMRSTLKSNIEFACAMARVKYLRDAEPIPDINEANINIAEEMGKYWNRAYNTNEGKGTLSNFIEYWNKWMV